MSDYMLVHANCNITSMFLTRIKNHRGLSMVKKLIYANFCKPKLILILKINKFRHLELFILFKINCFTVFDPQHIITAPGNKLGIVRGDYDRCTH